MAAAQSMMAKLGIDTADPVTKRFNFVSGAPAKEEELVDGNGLRGTLSHADELVRAGNVKALGQLVLQPTALEWSYLLPWIMGGAPSGAGTVTYPLSDAAPTARYVVADMVTKVYKGSGYQVDKCVITGEEGKNLVCALDIVGVDVDQENAGTFPAIDLDVSTQPFLFTDLVYSWGGSNYRVKNFRIEIDHLIDKERHFNSRTILSAVRTDRRIMVMSDFGLGDSSALYGAGSSSGVQAVATFTNGSNVLTFTMVKVRFPTNTPPVENRSEILLPVRGQAFKSGSTLELVTTLAM